MPEAKIYLIPATTCRTEYVVLKSRFVTTIARVSSTDEAKAFLNSIRNQMNNASHHAYAFRVGHGKSVVDGMSDAGEPPGTAGAPILSVLRGTDIGDIIVVVTRYFGGAKLGTGGLVRAYTKAAKTGLAELKTEQRIPKSVIRIETSYNLYDAIRRLIAHYSGSIEDEVFTASVTIIAAFPTNVLPYFSAHLLDITAGKVEPVILSDS